VAAAAAATIAEIVAVAAAARAGDVKDERTAVLEADSLAVGDAWVERVKLDLRKENRQAAGGWPGTMREARARTYAYFTNADVAQRYGVLSPIELEHAVRAVYDRARGQWLACAQTDDEEENA
jgi:hypothetical protein